MRARGAEVGESSTSENEAVTQNGYIAKDCNLKQYMSESGEGVSVSVSARESEYG